MEANPVEMNASRNANREKMRTNQEKVYTNMKIMQDKLDTNRAKIDTDPGKGRLMKAFNEMERRADETKIFDEKMMARWEAD